MCAKCHGPEGKGDGEAAVGAQPADLTAKLVYGSSDGEIYSAIHDGTSKDMEGYGDRLQPNDIWNVVNYIQSVRKYSRSPVCQRTRRSFRFAPPLRTMPLT